MVKIFTIDEMVSEIAEVLREADGEFVEDIANMVLSPKVNYTGDSLFQQNIEE